MINLIPTIGVDSVDFGQTSDAVESVYGPATEVHTEDDREVFEYTDKGLAFFFDGESIQLNEIEINRKEVTIWGVQLMSASMEAVNKVISENTDVEVNKMQHEGTTYLFVEDIGLSFSFQKNKLVTVTAEV